MSNNLRSSQSCCPTSMLILSICMHKIQKQITSFVVSDFTNGITCDYAYGALGVKYSYSPELRGPGFAPGPETIEPAFNELYAGLVAILPEIELIESGQQELSGRKILTYGDILYHRKVKGCRLYVWLCNDSDINKICSTE